jgi:hypothetical protein
VIEVYYTRLRERGKSALTACLRTILVILNTKFRDGANWGEHLAAAPAAP